MYAAYNTGKADLLTLESFECIYRYLLVAGGSSYKFILLFER
jgi:hypothetical protein